MKINWKRLGTTIAIVVLPLLLTRCLITSVNQPSTANKGQQITVILKAYDNSTPSNGLVTDKGVLCVMVPNDWTLVSSSYTGQEKGQTLVHKGVLSNAQNWADSAESVISSGINMKWIGLLSDSAYVYADTLFMTDTLKLLVGQTTGTFNIGYLITKNGGGLINDFADGWSDTAMYNKIVIQAGSGVEAEPVPGTPASYRLEQNYPNPFNPSTMIRYTVKERSTVQLAVYDIDGREVAVLVEGTREPGVYEVNFTPQNFASGVYMYKLRAGNFTETRKMVMMK